MFVIKLHTICYVIFLLELGMQGYIKRDKVNEIESSENLPENAMKWIMVFKKSNPKFTYKFVDSMN